MKVMILANNDVGLYQFRKELIEELLKQHEVVISLPDGDFIKPLEDIGCKFIGTPVDRRGINPVTDLKLFHEYLRLLKQEKQGAVNDKRQTNFWEATGGRATLSLSGIDKFLK